MNEPEWRDANPATEDLPNKGKTVISFIVAGIALGVLTVISVRFRQVGLAVGGIALISGIGIFMRKQKTKYKLAAALTSAGFLMLLTFPPVGIMKAIAMTVLIIGAVGLVVMGIGKAIKLSWDLSKRS